MSVVSLILRASCVAMLPLGSAALTQPVLTALAPIEPGLWQLKAEGEAPRAICVRDPAALFQLRHGGSACSRLVIDDAKAKATVHYSCPGAGWGRTTVRVSTPNSVRVATQGIADNAPFDFRADARRTGDCPTRSASR